MKQETKNQVVEIDGKTGEYTGFSGTTCTHNFSMYDGSVKRLSELEAIRLFGVDFVTPSHSYNQQPQDTSTRKDEYISKNLWRDDDGFIAQGSGDNYITFADTNVNDDDIDDRERRTDEIIEAYNGTIAKGYNPAAMEELIKALTALTNMCGIIPREVFTLSGQRDFQAILNASSTALTNAKTIKP